MSGKIALSAEEIELKGEHYTILSMLIYWGNKTEKFCESAKEIAEKLFVPLTDEERAAKLEELKEFARMPSSGTMHRKFERLAPGTIQWNGTIP